MRSLPQARGRPVVLPPPAAPVPPAPDRHRRRTRRRQQQRQHARNLEGADRIARVLAGVARRIETEGFDLVSVHVGGQPAIAVLDADGALFGVWSLIVENSTVTAIHGVVNPEKLTPLGRPVKGWRPES